MNASRIFARLFERLHAGDDRYESAATAQLAARWSERARTFGRRCVYDLSVSEDDFDGITAFQEAELFPLLRAQLAGAPKRVLDYGCGAGRFTVALREFTGAKEAVGYDLCPELIEMARAGCHDAHSRFTSGGPRDFFGAQWLTFDLIWIATVLGGVNDADLAVLADDLTSSLSRGGLIFFAENTAPIDPNNTFWKARPVAWYEQLFDERGVRTKRIGSYVSCKSEVSVFAGRKGA
jgi:SAM-dependent methyltransferase